jgi:hypothetical protein
MDGEKRRNEIEILAQEVVQESPSYSPSVSNISGGSTRTQEFGG